VNGRVEDGMSESQYRLDVDLPEINVTTDESTSRGGSREGFGEQSKSIIRKMANKELWGSRKEVDAKKFINARFSFVHPQSTLFLCCYSCLGNWPRAREP
jgi:hypothetical protein